MDYGCGVNAAMNMYCNSVIKEKRNVAYVLMPINEQEVYLSSNKNKMAPEKKNTVVIIQNGVFNEN